MKRTWLVISLVSWLLWCSGASADGLPVGWSAVATYGFGDPSNLAVTSLCAFDGQLYAGTLRPLGADVWRWDGTNPWIQSAGGGINVANNTSVGHMIVFNGQLYAGTENNDGAEVWRTQDGLSWWRVVQRGFNDPGSSGVSRFAVFDGKLYAATWSYTSGTGCRLWRSPTGNQDHWLPVMSNGFNDANNLSVLSFELFKGYLYAGTRSFVAEEDGSSSTGGEVWRTADGMIWRQVNADGFGSPDNQGISALANYGVYLYASTLGSQGHGAEVWRCRECDGSDWLRVAFNGFGNANLNGPTALQVHGEWLYLAIGSRVEGMEVWRTNAETWQRVGWGGLGQVSNQGPTADGALMVFRSQLVAGVLNAGGAQVWRYSPGYLVLPLIFR